MWGPMESLSGALVALLLLSTPACGQQGQKATAQKAVAQDTPAGTVFNGQDVPPIVTLSGQTYQDTIEVGYWLVEAYSPYCGHCQSLAPKWQTLYEYYYTSDPIPASTTHLDTTSIKTFTGFYNLKFAKLDCIAFGTACSEIKVTSYPALILFKNGEETKRSEGDRDIKKLSKFIEECLEIIRPNSRPKDPIPLPKVGAEEFYPPGTAPKPRQPAIGHTGSSQISLSNPQSANRIPNTAGTSIPLTAETFKSEVTRSLNPWFIKFYAPWCTHCQKMAASWSSTAREMHSKLDIGEVDCVAEKKLCKEMGITSYPTIAYFRGPERMEYEGMRGLGDLIAFGHEAVQSNEPVRRVSDEEFLALEMKHEVIFVYFYDHATTSEDMLVLDRLPMALIGRAKIVKTDDIALGKRLGIFTYPRLIVWRDGKIAHFERGPFDPSHPQYMRNVDKVRGWMQSVWEPLVPELTAQNARDIMDGKFVVLGLLNRESEEFEVAKREIKNAATEWMGRVEAQFVLERQELRDAKQLRIEEAEDRNNKRALKNAKEIRIMMDEIYRKEVAFAWVDAAFWERWIRTTFGITVREDGERVVINDHDNRRYWDTTSTGNPMVPSRTSILETLTQVHAVPPKLPSKPTGSSVARFFYKSRQLLTGHPWLCAGAAAASLALALLAVRRGRGRRRSFGSGGFFKVESEKEIAVGGKAD